VNIVAEDETALEVFTNEVVKNTLPVYNQIPGRIQAEDFFFQSGIQLDQAPIILNIEQLPKVNWEGLSCKLLKLMALPLYYTP